MTIKMKYLLITGLLMLVSSGVFAGPIVGSITFTGTDFTDLVVSEGDFGVPGTTVQFSLIGWTAGEYSFNWDSLLFEGGLIKGEGMLEHFGGNSTLALLSGGPGEQEGFITITTTAVPEPQTLALLGIALLAFGTIRLSRSRNRR